MLMQPCNDATCLLHEISFSLFYVHWYALWRCVVLQTLGFNRNPVFSLPMTKWRTTSCPDHLLQNPLLQNPLQSQTSFKKAWRNNMKSYESSKFTLEWNCKIRVDTLVFHWVSNGFLVLQLLKSFGRIMKTDDAQSGSLDPRSVKPETDLYRACEVRHVPRRSSCLSDVNLDVSSWHSSHISVRPGTKAL